MTRVVITLNETERAAIVRLAQTELRSPSDQARYLLREALAQRGALESYKALPIASQQAQAGQGGAQ